MRIKSLLFLGLILLLIHIHSFGQNYEQRYKILSVYPFPIIIGGKEVYKGDTVFGSSTIEISSSNQILTVVRCGKEDAPTTFNYNYLKDLASINLDNAWEKYENVGTLDTGNGTLGPKGDKDSNTKPYLFFHGATDSTKLDSEKRLAIIIGNSTYTHPNLGVLKKPSIDADNMQNKLFLMGFDVMEVRDVDERDMKKAFDDFFYIVAEKGYQMALIYFSGHGVWYEGREYLLPCDAEINNKYVEGKYYSAYKLLTEFRNKVTRSPIGPKLIIIMDACRKEFVKDRKDKEQRKMDIVEEERVPVLNENELLFYAVSIGENSLQGDNNGLPSPFTAALIDGIGTGESIYEEFYQIKIFVKNKYVEMNPSLIGLGRGWFDENFFVKKRKSTNSKTQNDEN